MSSTRDQAPITDSRRPTGGEASILGGAGSLVKGQSPPKAVPRWTGVAPLPPRNGKGRVSLRPHMGSLYWSRHSGLGVSDLAARRGQGGDDLNVESRRSQAGEVSSRPARRARGDGDRLPRPRYVRPDLRRAEGPRSPPGSEPDLSSSLPSRSQSRHAPETPEHRTPGGLGRGRRLRLPGDAVSGGGQFVGPTAAGVVERSGVPALDRSGRLRASAWSRPGDRPP